MNNKKIDINKCASLAFTSARKNSVVKWFAGSFSTIIAVLFFLKDKIGLSAQWSLGVGIPTVILILIAVYIYYFVSEFNQQNVLDDVVPVTQNSVNTTNSSSGDCIIVLRKILSDIEIFTPNATGKEYLGFVMELCTDLKRYFDRVTQCNCCVSIKVAAQDNTPNITADDAVRNLCRDTDSANSDHRNPANYNETPHYIVGNTPYIKIVNQIKKKEISKLYYVNTNVPDTKGYDSTSSRLYENGLPYKSEIVCAIYGSNDKKDIILCGFICLDCPEPFEFALDEHLGIIQIVASKLYHIISLKTTTSVTISGTESAQNA